MGNIIEVTLTILALSFWILFPVGIFLSVSRVDKNTDQVIRLEQIRQEQAEPYTETEAEEMGQRRQPVFRPVPFDWHHPIIYFRQWLQHE